MDRQNPDQQAVPSGLARVESDERVRLSGFRDGRQVEIRFADGAMVTWVRAAVPDLQALGNSAGGFVVDPGAPPGAVEALRLAGAVAGGWRDVRVRGGADGLIAVRRSGFFGYLYDLWLLERLATALDGVALDPVDAARAVPPYRTS